MGDAVKKTAPDVIIPPEHQITLGEIMKDYAKTKQGPGTYDLNYKQTEERQDKAAVIKKPYFMKIDDYDEGQEALYPNYKLPKPNKLVFKYFQPAKVGPKHVPDSVENSGRWVYYDV